MLEQSERNRLPLRLQLTELLLRDLPQDHRILRPRVAQAAGDDGRKKRAGCLGIRLFICDMCVIRLRGHATLRAGGEPARARRASGRPAGRCNSPAPPARS